MENENLLLEMITHLRQNESILLYGKLAHIPELEDKKVSLFLATEYKTECKNYPFDPPNFNEEAAIWAAKTIYIAANLLLDRVESTDNLEELFPIFNKTIDASAHISADLCLRFLPVIITELRNIDSEDILIELLENILKTWHYSGCQQIKKIDNIDFTTISENECFHQLYCDRIIFSKNSILAKHPAFQTKIKSALGDYNQLFWPELND